jgi:tetratricopeptide (TPR) repeat protein
MSYETELTLLIRAESAYQEAFAQPEVGRRIAGEVAALAREAHDYEALAVALRAAGLAARELYDHRVAIQLLDEAVDVAADARLGDRQAEALITRSAVFLELGKMRSARRDIDVARAVAGRRTRAEVAFAEGLLEDKAGDFAAAAAAYRTVMALVDGDRLDLRFKALNNLGMTQLRTGHTKRAERLLREAAELAATFSPAYEAHVTESLATVASQLGDPVEALRRYEQAEKLFAAVGMPLVDLHRNKATTLLALRMLDEALESARRAVTLVDQELDVPLLAAEALLPLAEIALVMGRYTECLRAASRAETLLRSQKRPGWRCRAALLVAQAEAGTGVATDALLRRVTRIARRMIDLDMPAAIDALMLEGRLAAELGRGRKAVTAWQRAATVARGRPVLRRLQGTYARALVADARGDRRRLSQLCRHGLVQLAEYRATFASRELRARAASYGAALADLATASAVRSGRPHEIWSWLERGRGVVFTSPGTEPAEEGVRSLLAELREAERGLRDAEPGSTDPALARRVGQLERDVRSAAWQVSRRGTDWILPNRAMLAEVRSRLTDRVLLQFGVLDDRIVGVAVSDRSVSFAELASYDVVAACRRRLASALRRLAAPRSKSSADVSRAGLEADLRGLSESLLAPFEDHISAATEVVVSPPSDLVGLPWAAIAPLDKMPVRIVPSAVAWYRTARRRPASERVVAIAGPDLPAARTDVDALSSAYGDATVALTGAEATSDAVSEAATGARLVHIACHGRLRADSPSFSSLALADGPMTVHDIEHLREPAHHWVLAACDLGVPGDLLSRELDGVLAALLYGGAAGVVAAVASVPDAETSAFMADLHEQLADGASLAVATAAARARRDPDVPEELVVRTAFSCYGGG